MTTPAISIIRVSGDGQDESSQRGSCQRAADREDLHIVREIPLHAVSGFKGDKRHLAAMADALNAVRTSEAQVIVVAHSSRAARLPHRDVVRWMWDVEDAGGRFVSDDEQSWAAGSTPMHDAWNVITAGENHKKSLDISAHVNRGFRAMDDRGAFRGQPPAGYEAVGEERHKHLVPAASRRSVKRKRKGIQVTVTLPSAQDIRDAFNDAESTSTVKLGKRLGFTPDGVAKLLRSRVYSSGQYPVRRKDGVTVVHKCEPLVKPEVQARAITAVERRHTGDNVSSRALAKDDYSGALWCGNPDCGRATMHRYYSDGRKNKDGSRRPKVRRYLCRQCRKSVKADAADAAVNAFMAARKVEWLEPVWMPGNDYQADLDRVNLELRELPGRGLGDEEEDAERARLRAERGRLEALPRETGHWTGRLSGISEGARWTGMVTSERRAWLVSGEFRIYVAAKPGRTGDATVELVYADGDVPESVAKLN